VGAIIFTYLSTFIYHEELAVSTMGTFSKQEAESINLETQIYKGWPQTMLWFIGIPKVNSTNELLGLMPALTFLAFWTGLTLIPNLLFWGFSAL